MHHQKKLDMFMYSMYIFLVSFLLLFKIGSYPDFFDPVVEHMIHPAVNKVLDHKDIGYLLTWKWTSMHQHGSYASPIYTSLIEIGIRLFGFNLVGVRLLSSLLCVMSILYFSFSLKKSLSRLFVFYFIILLCSSPWFLVFQRSGGIFSISLTIILLLLTFLLETKNSNKLIYPFLLGALISVSPYAYATIRLIPILILMAAIFYFFKTGLKESYRKLILLLLPVLCSLLLQFTFFGREPFYNYFESRGESLVEIKNITSTKSEMANLIFTTLLYNSRLIYKGLFGLNPGTVILDNYWSANVILYPRFLVIFFVSGLLLSIRNFLINKKSIDGFILIFFAISLLPGLLARIGGPNPSRLYPLIIPLYYFVSLSLEKATTSLYLITNKKTSNNKLKDFVATIPVLFAIIIFLFQYHNFFNHKRYIEQQQKTRSEESVKLIYKYLSEKPDSKIIFHEHPPFGNYSYVIIRFLGGNSFQKLIDSKKVVLFTNENRQLINDQLLYYDYFISISDDRSDIQIPYLLDFPSKRLVDLTIFSIPLSQPSTIDNDTSFY